MMIAEAINELTETFEFLPDWEERYAHIISLGKTLPPYPESGRTDAYKVRGCQSLVWLHPNFDGSRIHFDVDSDAVIVKGLIAMLMGIYNDRTPDEILATPPDFIATIGLNQHLSKSRSNGLASMARQIMTYATEFNAMSGTLHR